MFNKLTILATVVVVVSVMSTVCGHPAAQSEDLREKIEETTTAKIGGIRGWFKDVHEKIRGPSRGCNHTHEGGRRGGPWNWVKNKLGFGKTTTAAPWTTTAVAVPGVDDDEDRRTDTAQGSNEGERPEIDEAERPDTTGDDEFGSETGTAGGRPEFADETPTTGNRDTEIGTPETEIQDKSDSENVFPQPAPVTESGAENDSNGFSGEDLTPQSTSSSEVIDPRIKRS